MTRSEPTNEKVAGVVLESCDYTLTYPQLSDQAMALYTAITRARNQLYFIEVEDFGRGKKRKAGVPLADYALRRLSDLKLTKPVTSVDEGALEMSSAQHKARGVLLVTQAIAMSRRNEPFSTVAKKLQDAIERFSPANGNDYTLERLANRSLQCLSDKKFLIAYLREKFYGGKKMEGLFLDVLHFREKLANFFEAYGIDSFVKFEVAEIVQIVQETFNDTPYWSSFEEVCAYVKHLQEPIRTACKPTKNSDQPPAPAPTAKRPSQTQEISQTGVPQPNPSGENRTSAAADETARVTSPRLNPEVATFTPGGTGMAAASILPPSVNATTPLNAESIRTSPEVAASFVPSANATSFVPKQLARPVPVSPSIGSAPNPLYAAALASFGRAPQESASSGSFEGEGQQHPANRGANEHHPRVSSPLQHGRTGGQGYLGGNQYSQNGQYSAPHNRAVYYNQSSEPGPPIRGGRGEHYGSSYGSYPGYSRTHSYDGHGAPPSRDGGYPGGSGSPDHGQGYDYYEHGGNNGSYSGYDYGPYDNGYEPRGAQSYGHVGQSGAAHTSSRGAGYPGSSGYPNHGQGDQYYDGY